MPFSPSALQALLQPGVSERWQAVQRWLHPEMLALANRASERAATLLPQQWPLYELSFKARRAIDRGKGRRDPIEDYWFAFDRPPRGAGVMLTVSGVERTVTVGLQLWGVRRPQLARLWREARPLWEELIDRIGTEGQARFASRRPPAPEMRWVDHYLAQRQAQYLWAGFVYPWDNLPPDERLIDDLCTLLPLNEALMELAEIELATTPTLREAPERYHTGLPPFAQIAAAIRRRGMVIDERILEAFHLAVQARPLVILAGPSGSGKTWLTRLYADALIGADEGQTNPIYLLVAVQPDWHSARDLLGYYNTLTGLYQPTAFLRHVLKAAADPDQTYIVCLDEMNLARPEYYLAPILSAMETAEGLIDLGTPLAETPLASGGVVRNPLRLPANLRLIGTVNVDESTFLLSDKVLDRANLLELGSVDLNRFRAVYQGSIDDQIWQMLAAIQTHMAAAGKPAGYRALGETLRFIEQASSMSAFEALDMQMLQRLLPRLRGDDTPRFRQALRGLHALCEGRLLRSAARLEQMLARLDREGYTDFYG
ncbi:AAA family ATPase [uncultured Chloroflexus sp.]|uniref:McrB family protein n=1 Tax=uncultured Chloroflexus sp. TaxID=214040 RepID=UPI002622E184|nr:AAA family ATPase [uncultured Chloroflexus sp.]